MSIKQLNPYLTFNGTAGEAIQRYERALGAKTESLQRFGEVSGMSVPDVHRHRVLHAQLRIGAGILMLSDAAPEMPVATEGNVHVCVDLDDLADATTRFNELAVGGKVTMPLQDTFWGATFGMLIDAYGVSWMFNCKKPA